jgi:16S rRNA (cytidine1402-2'-O)-methyltransferase
MTKIHEEHRVGTLAELAEWARTSSIRGELTLVIGPSEYHPSKTVEIDLLSRFLELTQQGQTRRQAVKVLARELGRPARQIYDEVLSLQSTKSRENDENP